MKQWKRFLLTAIAVMAAAIGAILTACATREEVVVTLQTYDEQTITLTGERGNAIEFPDVTRDGYLFDGWYATSDLSGEPVTSAVFEENTTYYAAWSRAYTVTLELDGGTLAEGQQTAFLLREGTLVAQAVADYVPVKGDCRFGGWYVGDTPLSSTLTIAEGGITLTARYMAQYTVNVYLQNVAQDDYELQENYESGYALIGENYMPSVTVTGFSQVSGQGDVSSLVIGENADQNVFVLHFDRRSYTILFNTNLPDGTSESENATYVYGETIDLNEREVPQVDANYRYFGWAEFPGAEPQDCVPDNYTVTGSAVLYIVWNRAYTDLFNGSDLLFLNYDEGNTAVLSRGGIDIAGDYWDRNDCYRFYGMTDPDTSEQYVLYAMVNEDSHTFIFYYSGRAGDYRLYTDGSVSDTVSITLGQLNELTYRSESSSMDGTYVISEDGYYVAELSDGTQFTFLLGTANGMPVFRIRGDEFGYGALYQGGVSGTVSITLDGFGNATLAASDGTTASCYYSLEEDILTLYDASDELGVFRILQYGNTYGYEAYTAALDNEFVGSAGALTLDGCSNATFVASSYSYTGTYTAVSSWRGGYLITVTSGVDTYYYRVYDRTIPGTPVSAYILEELNENYAEYVYFPEEGLGNTLEALLVVTGDGTATLYELNDSGTALEEVSSGTFEESSAGSDYAYGTYVYTVVGDTESWAQTQVSSMIVGLDSTTGLNVYYILVSTPNTGEEGQTINAVTYRTEEGNATLIIAAEFAIYIDASGNIVSGYRTDYTNYTRLTGDDDRYHYFILHSDDPENLTFEVLTTSPLVMTKRESGTTDRNTTLTVTGRAVDGDAEKVEAIYSDGDGNIAGYYTVTEVSGVLGYSKDFAVYTFTATDGSLSFRFLFLSSTSSTTGAVSYYFDYYASDADIIVSTFNAVDAQGMEDETATLSVVITPENVCELVYTTNVGSEEPETPETVVRGTYSEETITVFGDYTWNVYTFTPSGSGTAFEFTLVAGTNANYFRIAETPVSITMGDDSKLELNGTTLIGRYTTAAGETLIGIYSETENVLDSDEKAYVLAVSVGSTTGYLYFDLENGGTSFRNRGSEAGTYDLISNRMRQGVTIVLDGYDNATVTIADGDASGSVLEGTYREVDGYYVVTVGEGADQVVYTGTLGYVSGDGNTYDPAFFARSDGFAGAYLDRSDLSVLVLDEIGNAVKYNALGRPVNGMYVMLDNGLFYYMSNDQSESAMYTITDTSVVTASTYSATFYASDLAAVVFYMDGTVQFGNTSSAYYTYDAADGFRFYTLPEEGESTSANDYGYVVKQLAVSDGDTLIYNDTTYYLYNGGYILLTAEDGSTLEFMPSGATFTVEARYTPASTEEDPDPDTLDRYVIVNYTEEGQVEAQLAYNVSAALANSSNGYIYTVTNPLTLNIVFGVNAGTATNSGSFSMTENDTYQLTLYSYQYLYILANMGIAFDAFYGYLSISGTMNGEEMQYSVSGAFNSISGVDGEPLTFTDGRLSAAGYRNPSADPDYGHVFTLEFQGSDEQLYHMNFYAAQFTSGIYCYIIYSLTRATELATGTVGGVDYTVYSEEFVSSDFRLSSGTGDDGETIYYAAGDTYLPSVKYNGELAGTTVFEQTTEEGQTVWTFTTYKMETTLHQYIYVFTFTEENETVTPVSLSRRTTASGIASGSTAETNNLNGSTVYFIYDMTSGEIVEIYAFAYNGIQYSVSECTKDGNTFTIVVTSDNTNASQNGATLTITFNEVVDSENLPENTVTIGDTIYTITAERVFAAEEGIGSETMTAENM